jgi:protocatechuate 3,4-dioxygenase beta subunit
MKQTQVVARRRTTEDDITAEVLRRLDSAQDARLRRIMLSLIQHLHHFIKDVELTEAEWLQGIQFLTDTGKMSSDTRQEFILLSDTLGVSMVVDLINHRMPEGATESTVFGPCHHDGAPELATGSNLAPTDTAGMPTVVSGRVLDLQGRPIAGALLDTRQYDSTGRHDQPYEDKSRIRMRGMYHTGKDGRFVIRTSRPVAYEIPNDGPVGKLLRATDRHAWRPAHIHFVVSAEGFAPVTTHIFDSVDKYLESDAVFAVKESLICTFTEHHTRDEAAKQFNIEPPFCTAEFDFVLKPARR